MGILKAKCDECWDPVDSNCKHSNCPHKNMSTEKQQLSATIKVDTTAGMTAKIPVTRFIRPNGQRQQETIQVNAETTFLHWRRLQRFFNDALRLTVEDSGNGMENLCIQHPHKGDIEIAVINPKKVDRTERFAELIKALHDKVDKEVNQEPTP